MPYIKPELRQDGQAVTDCGILNYRLTMMVLDYWRSHPHRYQTLNDILGAFEGAKLEFYRRIVVPYEEEKIREHGDVYP